MILYRLFALAQQNMVPFVLTKRDRHAFERLWSDVSHAGKEIVGLTVKINRRHRMRLARSNDRCGIGSPNATVHHD